MNITDVFLKLDARIDIILGIGKTLFILLERNFDCVRIDYDYSKYKNYLENSTIQDIVIFVFQKK